MRKLQLLAWDWGVRCFGLEHMRDVRVRAVRLIEEAVEYGQSTGVQREQLHKLVDMVYAREVGESYQELGGVLITTMVSCANHGWQIEDVAFAELRRCLGKSPEEFARRNREKLQLGMTG